MKNASVKLISTHLKGSAARVCSDLSMVLNDKDVLTAFSSTYTVKMAIGK